MRLSTSPKPIPPMSARFSRHQPTVLWGWLRKGNSSSLKQLSQRVRFDLDKIEGFVPIIATYAGMKTDLLDLLDPSKIDGLIIEAFGAGNIPKETAHKLQEFIDAGLQSL